jgi:hypothetical protein
VGIASDYYYPAEQLVVDLPEVVAAPPEVIQPIDNTPRSSSHRKNIQATVEIIEVIEKPIMTAATTIVEKEIYNDQIVLDISINDFIEKYKTALKGMNSRVANLTALQSMNDSTYQTASVIEAVESVQSKTPKTFWFNKLLKLLGI